MYDRQLCIKQVNHVMVIEMIAFLPCTLHKSLHLVLCMNIANQALNDQVA